MRRRKARTTEYSFAASIAGALRMVLGIELLFQSLLLLLSSEFTGWEIPLKSRIPMHLILIFLLVLYEVAAPACRKYRIYFYTLIEVLYLGGGAAFLLKKYKQLEGSYQALYTDYVEYWNKQFQTNYIGYTSQTSGVSFALAYTVLAVFLLFVILRYVTGIRLFLLVPEFAALSLGLLVTAKPGWSGLAFLFVGTLIVYSGPWDKTKADIRERNSKDKNMWRTQTASVLVTAVFGVLVVLLSGTLFSGIAQHIPDKKSEFLEFQQTLENNINNLQNLTVVFSQKKASVNNSTPEYHDQEILEIHASVMPETNLYLQDFYSGTYRRSQWKSEGSSFSKAAKQAGYDPDHVGNLLHQELYENVRAAEENTSDCAYSITYKYRGIKTALVPYFSDLSDSGNSVWVEDEGVAAKKRGLDTVSFRGLAYNLDSSKYLWAMEGESDALNWYSQYALEHYRTGSDEIEALDQYVDDIWESIADKYGDADVSGTTAAEAYAGLMKEDPMTSYFFSETNEDAAFMNMARLDLAELVQKKLEKEADYNLYLDSIPNGTDTIQYFLETGHEGYCMHFASAGTLLLQELGVPARYASGYVVKPSAFTKEGEDYVASVEDRNGHAWVEIYLEGIGWVPYEMTPGYNGSSQLPTSQENQSQLEEEFREKSTQQEDNSTSESQTQEVSSEDDSEDTQTETGTQAASLPQAGKQKNEQVGKDPQHPVTTQEKAVGIVLGVFAVLLVLFLVFVMTVNGMRRYKETLAREIRRKQYRSAVRRMNHRIYRRLWKHLPVPHLSRRKNHGFHTSLVSMTDEDFLQKLIIAYPAISKEEWMDYLKIVQKAAFSTEAITEEELQFCYHIYRMHRQK